MPFPSDPIQVQLLSLVTVRDFQLGGRAHTSKTPTENSVESLCQPSPHTVSLSSLSMSSAKDRHYQQLASKLQSVSRELQVTQANFAELAKQLQSMNTLGAIQAAQYGTREWLSLETLTHTSPSCIDLWRYPASWTRRWPQLRLQVRTLACPSEFLLGD